MPRYRSAGQGRDVSPKPLLLFPRTLFLSTRTLFLLSPRTLFLLSPRTPFFIVAPNPFFIVAPNPFSVTPNEVRGPSALACLGMTSRGRHPERSVLGDAVPSEARDASLPLGRIGGGGTPSRTK